MIPAWPRAWGTPSASALIRCRPEDFVVTEELGFEPDGDGEHVFLFLQKRRLNSADLVRRVAALSGVAERDIGISGLKDRNAVTSQWLSIGLAGRSEPDWQALQSEGDVKLLRRARHGRKLRRGVHRANRFRLVLREVDGDHATLEQRLRQIRRQGAPNYFGEQRFGRDGSTLLQALRWIAGGGRRPTRTRRGLYLSALRSFLFNTALAERVEAGSWNTVCDGDVCFLRGTRSLFACADADEQIRERAAQGDVHPGLPLWGSGTSVASAERIGQLRETLAEHHALCDFLEREELAMSWRPARLIPDDFYWQFCDDGVLQLDFVLGAGVYATALLAETVRYQQGDASGAMSEWEGR